MPVISRFYGIVIMMFFQDHNPPHFHAKYEGDLAVFSIADRRLIAGQFSRRATKLVKEWAKIHKKELMEDWNIAKKEGKLKTIEPLE